MNSPHKKSGKYNRSSNIKNSKLQNKFDRAKIQRDPETIHNHVKKDNRYHRPSFDDYLTEEDDFDADRGRTVAEQMLKE